MGMLNRWGADQMLNKKEYFEVLPELWTIERSGRFLPGAGSILWGAIVSCYETEAEAQGVIDELKSEDPEQFADLTNRLIGDVWEAVDKASGEGLCGFQITNSDFFVNRWPFVIRVEEASSERPTCIFAIRKEGGVAGVLTKSGVRQANCADYLPWKRFDILDRVNAQWGVTSPFRNHENGDSLWEILPPGGSLTVQENSILDEYATPEGVFAFFTSKKEAKEFFENEVRDSRYGIFSGPGGSETSTTQQKKFIITEIKDVFTRLKDLAELIPFGKFVINPNSHRENSAWGWVEPVDSGEHKFQELTKKASGHWIRSVSGVWKIEKQNSFKLIGHAEFWNGTDTFFQTGGQEIQLAPLKRSIVSVEHVPVSLIGISEIDAEELIEIQLKSHFEVSFEEETHQNSFVISAWDAVTGDQWEILSFCNAIEALQFLASFEREHDQPTRTGGAQACFMLGFAGSNAPQWEGDRSQRFQLGLLRIGKRIIRQGYSPSDANDIVALCNAALKTIHVRFAGYVGDLCISCAEAEKENLLETLELEECVDGSEYILDPIGESIAKSIMGESSWNFIGDKAQFFLSTALLDFQDRGFAPQLDYAPFSVQVVKALEVECGALFLEFWGRHQENLKDEISDIYEEKSCLRSLPNGKAPSLGEMARMFKNAKKADTPLSQKLAEFLSQIDPGGYLTSKKFCDKALSKALHKYRNGGAHDSAISYEVCRDCIHDLVGEKNNSGIIGKVAEIRSMSSRYAIK